MLNLIGKLKTLQKAVRAGCKLKLSAHFYIVIQSGKIYFIYKPHKESVVKIGNIKF